ncbi:glycosyltransferase family 2 protein [bacterium]|nr:glycosyltransferase family 2 protein [candidate division CSSED10-310 bacterium]
MLTVIIPVYNESRTIRTILDRVRTVDLPKQIIVVDDGSTDDTAAIVRPFLGEEVMLMRHESNRGKGSAIRTAMPYIQGTYTVIQDGDLEYNPADFVRMLETMEANRARVVYGSRILSHSSMSYLRYWLGGRGLTFFTNLLFGSKLTDEPTCYKMFETELLKSLDIRSTGFEFCPEVTAKILARKIPVIEVPIEYHPRSIEEGKKIRWRDGIIALRVLMKYRWPKIFGSDQSG